MSAAPRRSREVRRTRRGSRRRIQLTRNTSSASALSGGRSQSELRDRSPIVLAIMLVLGTALGVLHNRWRTQGRPDPVLSVVRLTTFPLQSSGSYAEAGLFNGWNSLFESRKLTAENARLQAENVRLTIENETLRSKAAEADRLRLAVGLVAQEKKPPLAAEVIGLLPTPHIDTITVSRGTRDGVRVQTIVRTPAGLVGQVIDAGFMSSEVLLLSDTTSEVGAIIRRNGKMQGLGILQGSGRGRPLKLIDITRETDVQPGDLVYSSGFGGVFPAEVPIGKIVSEKSEDAQFLKSAEVTPAAGMPGDLREVYLLRP